MKLTPSKLYEFLKIIEYNTIVLITQVVGSDVLNPADVALLKEFGIDPKELIEEYPELLQSYHWGRLSQILQDQAKTINEKDFKEYLKRGQYIPLNESEKYSLKYLETKTYSHIKGLGDRIKQTVSNSLIQNEINYRAKYESTIKDAVKRAIIERESAQQIVSEIGHKMDLWEKDLGRIAETELNNAFQAGRAERIKAEKGVNSQVYKEVYEGACRHCIMLYLTNGIGSKPIIFTLPELEANGTNIGLKVADWKPTIESVHPFCRCTLQHLPKGYIWDEEKAMFVIEKVERNTYGEKGTIKIMIGDQIRYV